MKEKQTFFDRNYDYYREQLAPLLPETLVPVVGGKAENGGVTLPFFGENYSVSASGVSGHSGERPAYDVCVILFRYLLNCPEKEPREKQWAAYRDFRDAAPLITYFTNEVEKAIALRFENNLPGLKRAGEALGGYRPNLDVTCDLALQFDALPRVPVVLLFNDVDDEFAPDCSMLFQRRTETFLDAECIAMLGRQLFVRLTEEK
ncbi:MAG: DUF3786 domain-containing protein [Desulfobacteraceae bacterium]